MVCFVTDDTVMQPVKAAMQKVSSESVKSPVSTSDEEAQAVLKRLRNLDFMHSKSLVQTNHVTDRF